MKVSVVVPTYNGERFIEATLNSVLNQTFTDFEVIVSDDASTDETIATVERFDDHRVSIVEDRSHVGPAGNWNRALAQAQGQYVKVLAQDDLLYPDNLQVAVDVLDADPTLAFVAVRRDVVGASGTILVRGRGLPGLCGRIDPVDGYRKTVRAGANLFGEGEAVLFRREASELTGGFDDSLPYVIDIDYWLRLLDWGPAFGICSTHAAFRVTGDSWSSALAREQGRQVSALIARVARDPVHAVSSTDLLIGKSRASANARLRRLFYARYRSEL